MNPIRLRKTWREIAEYLDDCPRPLKIIETINRVAPRQWTFHFSFSRAGKTDLLITSQPPLTTSEMTSILDGFLDELFLADEVIIHAPRRTHSIQVSAIVCDPPNHNELSFSSTSSISTLRGLQLLGFGRSDQLPRSLHHSQAIERAFAESTWLGSRHYATRSDLSVNWHFYGRTQKLLPTARSASFLGTNDIFAQDIVLLDSDGAHFGSAFAATSPKLTASTMWTDFGIIARHLLPHDCRLFTPASCTLWFVEIGISRLVKDYWETPGRSRLIRQSANAVDRALSELEKRDIYSNYKTTIRRLEKRGSALALARRQNRVQRADWLTYRGRSLQAEPTCENEVVVLLAKLEALNGIPFHQFQLVEYGRRGIDALAHFQVLAEDVPVTLGAVEIEYVFENFLSHRHPIEQVNLIVCWDFRNRTTTDPRLSQRSPWLYMFQDGDYLFPVLLLSRLPDVVRKEVAP